MMQKYIEIRRKKEEIKIKMKDFDPYGEEDWENESIKILRSKMVSNFKVFEELITPYNEEPPLIYSQHFQTNYDGFKQELLDDLKNKLIGQTINIEGRRQFIHPDEKQDPLDNLIIDGKYLKPVYRITVKDIIYDGSYRQQVYYINIISDDNKTYKLKKIVSEKTYNNFVKKVGKEFERIEEEKRKKERLRIKHFHHDPYSEENWEEDN